MEVFMEKHFGIKENNSKVLINSEDSAEYMKSAKEIADRAYILFILHLVTTYQIDSKDAYDYLSRFNIFFELNEDEVVFLNETSGVDYLSRSFKIENIHVLLWTLKRIDVLKDPTEVCNVKQIIDIFFPNDSLTNPSRFVYENNLKREVFEIEEMYELYFEYQKKLTVSSSNDINEKIVVNRYETLKWILNKQTASIKSKKFLINDEFYFKKEQSRLF